MQLWNIGWRTLITFNMEAGVATEYHPALPPKLSDCL